MAVAEPGILEIAEPEIRTHALPAQTDSASDWLCAWCLNPVASEKDRFSYGGQNEFSFKNPEGARFNVVTFLQTLGCREIGVPTLEHTWFPDHAWSYCVCDRCRMHLGWFYAGPSAFVGLIRDRIIQASVALS